MQVLRCILSTLFGSHGWSGRVWSRFLYILVASHPFSSSDHNIPPFNPRPRGLDYKLFKSYTTVWRPYIAKGSCIALPCSNHIVTWTLLSLSLFTVDIRVNRYSPTQLSGRYLAHVCAVTVSTYSKLTGLLPIDLGFGWILSALHQLFPQLLANTIVPVGGLIPPWRPRIV